MYLACSSQSFDKEIAAGRLTLAEWFRLCAEELGLKAVEVEDKHIGDPTPDRLAELRAAADRHRLEIVNIALMNNFGIADDAKRRSEARRTIAWMDVARTLQTRFLRTFAGWPEGDRGARWPQMIAMLQSILAEAERRGVRMVMENHNHNGFIRTAADVEAIFAEVHSPALGILLDTGNYQDGLPSIERTAHRAWHVHAKFTRVLPDGRDARVDYEGVVAVLRRAGYTGCLSIETEVDEPGADAVRRALAFLRGAIAA
jgi:sugar phosphate isomerase/epimerase